MRLLNICHRPVLSVDHGAPLRDAARLMRRHHVGSLAVTRAAEAGLEVIGMVTDRDIAIEALARDLDVATVSVGAIASADVVGVPAEATLDEAARRMRAAGVRRLIVRTPEGELAGIVSFDDLVEGIASTLGELAGIVRSGLERESGQRSEPPAPPPRLRVPAFGTSGAPGPFVWGEAPAAAA